MRALLQRVSEARVTVEGAEIGRCGAGLLILVCAMQGDSEATAQKLALKVSKLRIFKDAAGKMNRSVLESAGEALVVSQFTLAADTSRGNRPGFSAAAAPELGQQLYEQFAQALAEAMLVPEGVACLSLGTRTPLADKACSKPKSAPTGRPELALWVGGMPARSGDAWPLRASQRRRCASASTGLASSHSSSRRLDSTSHRADGAVAPALVASLCGMAPSPVLMKATLATRSMPS